MSSDLVAVVDQGSTATKGAVFQPDGERLALVQRPVERQADGPHVTSDPEAIAGGVVEILESLAAVHEIEALGIACQRSTCLIWERESARPLTPALSWQDRSQATRVDEMADRADLVQRITGLRLSPFYAAPKLAALLDEIPSGRERARDGELIAGTLDAFLIHRLTGIPATEPATAGRTLLYDLESGDWSDVLCDLFQIPTQALPTLRTSADSWGLWKGIPVTAVLGDQQASLLGHGGWRRGTTAAHFGTGAFVLASTGDRVIRHPGLLTAVLASTPRQRRFQIEGSVNSAGSAIEWARALTGQEYDLWAERALEPGAIQVLPSFAGTAAPWWRADSSAVISGLDASSSGEDLFEAVIRGVGQRVLDCVEAIRQAGLEIDLLRVSGKLTRLRGLMQFLADVGQLPVEGLVRLTRALIDEDDSGLSAAPGTAARFDPVWSPDQALALRARWLAFAKTALQLDSQA
jgi:glycerol kinase